MNIRTTFNKDENFSLFRRKRGQQDWEWKDYGREFLTDGGYIDMETFLADECETFTTKKEFVEYAKGNGEDYSKILEKFQPEKHLIVCYPASGDVWLEEKYQSCYIDMDSYEYRVGVAI